METTCEEFLQVTDHNRVSASSEINIQPELRWPTQNVIEAQNLSIFNEPLNTALPNLKHWRQYVCGCDRCPTYTSAPSGTVTDCPRLTTNIIINFFLQGGRETVPASIGCVLLSVGTGSGPNGPPAVLSWHLQMYVWLLFFIEHVRKLY